jgi:hypothetical protein
MTRPRHEQLADVSWISEKDGLPLITAIHLNRGGNYAVCPAVRRSDGALYDSKDSMIPENLQQEKWRLGEVSRKYQEMIYEARKLSDMEEEGRFLLGSNIHFRGSILIDLDSMESVDIIRGDNIYFEFVVDIGGIRFTDAKIMTKDKKLWLPVETF